MYKGKGPRILCSNCRPITPLSVPGKVFAHVLLACIQPLIDQPRRPQQSGFTLTGMPDIIPIPTDVACSVADVSACVFGRRASSAKTDEAIEMPFGDRIVRTQGSLY